MNIYWFYSEIMFALPFALVWMNRDDCYALDIMFLCFGISVEVQK